MVSHDARQKFIEQVMHLDGNVFTVSIGIASDKVFSQIAQPLAPTMRKTDINQTSKSFMQARQCRAKNEIAKMINLMDNPAIDLGSTPKTIPSACADMTAAGHS